MKWILITFGLILIFLGVVIQLGHSYFLKAERGKLKKLISGRWVYPYLFYQGNPVWLTLSVFLEILGTVIVFVGISIV